MATAFIPVPQRKDSLHGGHIMTGIRCGSNPPKLVVTNGIKQARLRGYCQIMLLKSTEFPFTSDTFVRVVMTVMWTAPRKMMMTMRSLFGSLFELMVGENRTLMHLMRKKGMSTRLLQIHSNSRDAQTGPESSENVTCVNNSGVDTVNVFMRVVGLAKVLLSE